MGVGTQIDGRVVAKDVGGDGRVDARLPARRRKDQGVELGADGTGQMAVEVRGDRPRKSDRAAPMRLAIGPDEMGPDLDQSLDHQHAAVIAKVTPLQGEGLVRAQPP